MQEQTDVIDNIVEEYKDILQNSNQAIIVFIDDENQISNGNFAKTLGYDSLEEWSAQGNVLENLDTRSREALVAAHQRAVDDKVASSRIVSWRKRNGEVVGTQVFIFPIPYHGSTYSMWFIDVNEVTGTFQV